MSDGLTDKRGQAKQKLTLGQLSTLEKDCKARFVEILLLCPAVQESSIKDIRKLSSDLANAVWVQATKIVE